MAGTEIPIAYTRCVPYLEAFLEQFPFCKCVPADRQSAVTALAAFYAVSGEMKRTAEATDYEETLVKAVAGQQVGGPYAWVFEAAADTINSYRLPVAQWQAILKGRLQEGDSLRFQSYEQLAAHLALVAAPVGQLVAELLEKRDAETGMMAGKLASALFLTNYWLNYETEAKRGRVYLPMNDLQAFGGTEKDITAATSPLLRKTLAVMAGRTRTLFLESRELSKKLPFPLNWKLRKVWLEGHFLLNKFGEQGYDPFRGKPTLTLRGKLRIFGLAMLAR